jgi:hypothetical protein
MQAVPYVPDGPRCETDTQWDDVDYETAVVLHRGASGQEPTMMITPAAGRIGPCAPCLITAVCQTLESKTKTE